MYVDFLPPPNKMGIKSLKSLSHTKPIKPDLPAGPVPPLTPGTTKKMTDALRASFESWEKDRERHNITKDPKQWTEEHVRMWLMWAIKDFSLEGISIQEFQMRGRDLVA